MARKRKRSTGADAPMIDKDYRARSDLDTLTRAEEVKADRARLTAAQKEADRQRASLSRIERLKDVKL